jgi:hypothetical protein
MNWIGWVVLGGVGLLAGWVLLKGFLKNRVGSHLIEIPKPTPKENLKKKAKEETSHLKTPDERAAEMRKKLRKLKKMFKEGGKG